MSDFFDNYDKNYKALEAKDKAAKAAGKVEGRYISEPYADGAALYMVDKVTPKTARISVIRLGGDDWVLPYWGESATIPLDYAKKNIARRDAMDRLFNR
jgi:hypothetical protein